MTKQKTALKFFPSALTVSSLETRRKEEMDRRMFKAQVPEISKRLMKLSRSPKLNSVTVPFIINHTIRNELCNMGYLVRENSAKKESHISIPFRQEARKQKRATYGIPT